MHDIMVDLETLGTAPGCVILSIGAVAFDEFGVSDEGFYRVVSRGDAEACGLHVDPDTEAWWNDKPAAARAVLTDPEAMRLKDALNAFTEFTRNCADGDYGVRIWGNGADFDLGILNAAYKVAGLRSPIRFGGRCYRTVKNQYFDLKLVRSGTHHHALDDARSQAEHMVAICRNRGWRLA